MNNLDISTDPALLDVELPRTLIESPSVSTFLPEEEASICPLLSNTNGTSTPLTFSHPLTPCIDNDSNLCNEEDAKAETSSSIGSSSGIGMDPSDVAPSTLFNIHAYQHLQINNSSNQDNNGDLTLSKDTPSFVSWNWPLIRKCTFFFFMSSLLAMCAVVATMIITLPKTCNPKTAWFRGSVFYEIFPASFQDSNNDGVGDIRGIATRIDYLTAMGISTVRLNSIFASPHYPDDYENIISLTEIAKVLGDVNDLRQLSESLHARNISLVLDLPINSYIMDMHKASMPRTSALTSTLLHANATTESSISSPEALILTEIRESPISNAIRKWMEFGVDGFYIKGLENLQYDFELKYILISWKQLMGPNRILIVSDQFINQLSGGEKLNTLANVDLVDVHLDVLNGTKHMEECIQNVLSSELDPTRQGAWIHWSIGGAGKKRITQQLKSPNTTLAATIMQLMLPGTPSIFYGDEIALESATEHSTDLNETKHLHHLPIMQWSHNSTRQFTDREVLPWLPLKTSSHLENFEIIAKMIALRERSPSIYKNAICKPEKILPNTQLLRSHDDILVVERDYPRRNSFVAVSNFGQEHVSMDMTTMYYSGIEMLPKSEGDKIYFSTFEIGPLETIVVKLDK